MYKNKKISIIISSVLSVLLVAVFVYTAYVMSFSDDDKKAKLTESEIEELREDYPLVYEGTADVSFMTMDREKEFCETYAYCEIVGDVRCSIIGTTTGDDELDEKLIDNGISLSLVQCYVPVKLIKDSEGLLPKGYEFSYQYLKREEYILPKPQVGSRIVIPLYINGILDEPRFEIGHSHTYYVTKDEYVLAVCNNEADKFTGLKVETLLNELKKSDEQRETYLKNRKAEYKKNENRGFESIEMLKEKLANKDK